MEWVFAGERRTIPLEDLIDRVPKLAEVEGKLNDLYAKQPGVTPQAARSRARRALERLVAAAVSDFGAAFVAGKSSLLDRILVSRKGILDFYDAMMDTKGKKPDPAALRGKFAELKGLLKDVSEPPEKLAAKQKPGDQLAAERKRITDELRPTTKPLPKISRAAGLTRLFKAGFRRFGDALVKVYKTGRVEYRLLEDGTYEGTSSRGGGTPSTFDEWGTLKRYKDKPLSSRVMQAHHGAQDALMANRFSKYGYDSGEAPTIWMRDSTAESPHGKITHEIQNPNRATRLRAKDRSFAKIREYAIEDLKAAGAPMEAINKYLKALDTYFHDRILPNIEQAVRSKELPLEDATALLGTNFGALSP